MAFVACCSVPSGRRRDELLARRAKRQADFDAGKLPDFLPETRADARRRLDLRAVSARTSQDRRVEITGPVDRKMIVNALNSGAQRLHGRLRGRQHAATGTTTSRATSTCATRSAAASTYVSPEGKAYALNDKTATLFVRPRGWHLPEKHVEDRRRSRCRAASSTSRCTSSTTRRSWSRAAADRISTCPNSRAISRRGCGTTSSSMAQDELGVPRGTIKATVLIETILAAFEMDEILYELREHSAGLNCGRWDYIFSCIKKFRNNRDFCLADRALVTMTTHFLQELRRAAASRRCHRRNIHAMGGMAAQIPVKNDEAANAEAFAKVKADKEREATYGHDGTWVAHPGLVPRGAGGVRPADAHAQPDRD